jgi:predicted outer membrane repeat protein
MVKLQTLCGAVVATASALLVARYNSWGPFNRGDGISVEHGRSLIFEFTGPAFCWVGFNAGLVDLPISLPIPLSLLNSCVCKDYQIATALQTASTSFAFATTIQLCGGTVSVEKPIDLTGKNVVFTCQTPFFFACGFNGNKKSRIIEGSPISAVFRRMKFENGNAESERKNVGGALYLTGGTVVMENVGFVNNQAGAGGAIYLEKDATVTISSGSFFGNKATKEASSAFVSAVDGMSVSDKNLYSHIPMVAFLITCCSYIFSQPEEEQFTIQVGWSLSTMVADFLVTLPWATGALS